MDGEPSPAKISRWPRYSSAALSEFLVLTNGAVILTSNGKTMTNEQLLPPGTTAPNFTLDDHDAD